MPSRPDEPSGPSDPRRARRTDLAAAPAPPPRLRSRVLLVDDAGEERAALMATLAPLGHPVVAITSASGATAAADDDFAVVVIDLRRSARAGFDTAEMLRANGCSQSTAIIFVTSHERAEHDMTIGYALGNVDFVVEPLVPTALRAKVTLFADLRARTIEVAEHEERLRVAAARSAEALALQMVVLERMDEVGRAWRDFVSKISRELRRPLTGVIGYVELLRDGDPGDPTPEQLRMLTIIERNGRRLLGLIADLATIARLEAGTFRLSVGPVNLGGLIRSVRAAIEPSACPTDLDLRVDLGPELDLVGDPEQLERALLYVVSNAVKFTSPPGEVEIATRTEGTDILVSVRDTGPGISVEDQARLFAPSFGATEARSAEVPGTGLGLYIVNQIVELHGGAMEVSASPAGTTFTMRLPINGPPQDPLSLVRG